MLRSSAGKGSDAIKPELLFMIENHQQEYGAKKKNPTKKPPILSEKFPSVLGNEALNQDISLCFISTHAFIQPRTAALPARQLLFRIEKTK